jgi:hypothetical protein
MTTASISARFSRNPEIVPGCGSHGSMPGTR